MFVLLYLVAYIDKTNIGISALHIPNVPPSRD